MIKREYIAKRGGIYCAIPIGKTSLDGNLVLRGMTDLMLGLRVLMCPTNTTLHVRVLVNDDRVAARELLVQEALAKDAAYIFWMDSDVIVPCDALVKMFARDADIIGGLVVTKSDYPQPLIIRAGESYLPRKFTPGDIVPCDAMGFGCTLMKTEIFKQLERPWFGEGYEAIEFNEAHTFTEDTPIMYRAKDAGFNCFVDTSIVCKHVNWSTGTKYSWDTEKNAPLIETVDGRKLTFFTAQQQLAYQEARDSQEEE